MLCEMWSFSLQMTFYVKLVSLFRSPRALLLIATITVRLFSSLFIIPKGPPLWIHQLPESQHNRE